LKTKSLPQLKKKALDLFAELSKLKAHRDGKLRCFTCGKSLQLNSSDTQLGHYLSRGAYPGLTFHPDNSRIQCMRCNCFLHGNTVEFRERLINEIGIYRVKELESARHLPIKLGRSDYLKMIELFKSEIKELDGLY
jgi:hypothetical protein